MKASAAKLAFLLSRIRLKMPRENLQIQRKSLKKYPDVVLKKCETIRSDKVMPFMASFLFLSPQRMISVAQLSKA